MNAIELLKLMRTLNKAFYHVPVSHEYFVTRNEDLIAQDQEFMVWENHQLGDSDPSPVFESSDPTVIREWVIDQDGIFYLDRIESITLNED